MSPTVSKLPFTLTGVAKLRFSTDDASGEAILVSVLTVETGVTVTSGIEIFARGVMLRTAVFIISSTVVEAVVTVV